MLITLGSCHPHDFHWSPVSASVCGEAPGALVPELLGRLLRSVTGGGRGGCSSTAQPSAGEEGGGVSAAIAPRSAAAGDAQAVRGG